MRFNERRTRTSPQVLEHIICFFSCVCHVCSSSQHGSIPNHRCQSWSHWSHELGKRLFKWLSYISHVVPYSTYSLNLIFLHLVMAIPISDAGVPETPIMGNHAQAYAQQTTKTRESQHSVTVSSWFLHQMARLNRLRKEVATLCDWAVGLLSSLVDPSVPHVLELVAVRLSLHRVQCFLNYRYSSFHVYVFLVLVYHFCIYGHFKYCFGGFMVLFQGPI